MRKFLFFVSCIVMCGGVPGAYALDLSLSDTVNKMLSESHDLKKAEANVNLAKAQLDAVNAKRWFSVDASANYMSLVNVERPFSSEGFALPPELGQLIQSQLGEDAKFTIPDNIFMAGLSITQPIYTFGKIGNAVDSVRGAIKMSESSREMTRRAIKYSATDMYWTAKMTDKIVELARKDLSDAVASKNKLTGAGRANRSNLVKIESDIASKEINLSDAEFNRDTAHRMLKILSGIDVNEELNLVDDFPSDFAELNVPEKLSSTPEWDVLQEQVNMYQSKASSQRANGYPTLAAVGNYSYNSMGNSVDHLFDKAGTQAAYWGLSLQVPIFSGGLHRANATVDAMNAEASRQDLYKSKKIVSEQYTNAIKKYNHLRGNLESLQNARDLAAKAYQFSQERFASGQTSAVELADVSSGLYQLDMALINSKYNILMAQESVNKLRK
ncbi:MAG: TolC family protein [Proteobacteria bacterium]|nr:TolC family protein [Candidatus Enterousia scatequi]